MAGNFGEPFQHFSERSVYKDTKKISLSECLKYGVGEKLDYSKLSVEQLKKVPKVIVKKLANAGKFEFQFQLKNMKKSDQELAKNQFFDMIYGDFRSTMLLSVRTTRRILIENEFQIQSIQIDTRLLRHGLMEIDPQLNKIHQKYLTGTETKESLVSELTDLDCRVQQMWRLVQLALQLVEKEGREITSIEPADQPSTSRWTGP